MRAKPVQKRYAFTLVELLVVIAIILILMALTVGVLSRVWIYTDEAKTTVEISKFAESCGTFKGQFGRNPPSKIILCEEGTLYAQIINGSILPPPGSGLSPAQFRDLGTHSVEYLSSIFSGINVQANHNWNGSLVNGNPNAPFVDPGVNGMYLLSGEQCLVYFLNGIRYFSCNGSGVAVDKPSTGIGFSTDKTNPTAHTTGTRLTFYTFDESRLDVDKYPPVFPAYKDTYGTPYAYFTVRVPGSNNYPNRYVPNFAAAIGPNDCEGLTRFPGSTVYFVPYFQGTVPASSNPATWSTAASFQFHRGDSFQIISAGKDKLFGTGGEFSLTNPEGSNFIPPSVLPTVTDEMLKANFDNVTNITNGRLVPQ